jgi:hypothetical protein
MPFLPSIRPNAKVPHVLALFSDMGSRTGKPLKEMSYKGMLQMGIQ